MLGDAYGDHLDEADVYEEDGNEWSCDDGGQGPVSDWLDPHLPDADLDDADDEYDDEGCVEMQFVDASSMGGEFYLDCLMLFLLAPLQFELEAYGEGCDPDELLADDRWQHGGGGMVPDDFSEQIQRAQWKACRQWGIRFEWSPSMDDFETQAKAFFRTLEDNEICTILEKDDYENPFVGMSPFDFEPSFGDDDEE
ncbi:MAG: hypothetical protein KAS72_14810 [Phycisphaerales bacterium]|nr:hypothetical protein [Phycisphaerales bacterium]